MELVKIIRGGQDAMDRGDYRLAVAASSHVLEAFPSCLTAHRMLGEAHLEQGETGVAIEHFNRAISVDPLNVVARLGLGVAAEENKAMEEAYAAYLHAWEINPALDQVRDELVRLRGLLGGDERLHPTRAGLAGIYIRGGQFGRAAAEWRAVIAAEPDNQRAKTSLAEVLWRSGDDAGALIACREVLKESTENVRALGMLADIEARRGSAAASEFVDRYQFVDPAGEILTLLSEWRDDLDLSFLRRESVAMPEFDFSATPMADRIPVSAGTVVAAGSAPGLSSSQFAAPDLWDTLVKDLKPGQEAPAAGAPFADDVMPFSWQDDGVGAAPAGLEPFALGGSNRTTLPQDLVAQSAPVEIAPSPADLSFEAEFASIPVGAAQSTAKAASTETTADLERFLSAAPAAQQPIVEPTPAAAPISAPSPARSKPKPADNQFVTADGRVDLTVGWDDLDRELRDATPNFVNATEMDALAAELGVEGIQPFEIGESPFDETAWAPFTDDDLTAPASASSAPAPEPVSAVIPPAPVVPDEPPPPIAAQFVPEPDVEPRGFEPIVEKNPWGMDDELVSSIPSQQASGYTEILRHVDLELPPEVEPVAEVDPFANPDSAGTPLEFEDLLAVTSSDGTSELTAPDTGSVPGTGQKSDADLWAEEIAAVQQMAETGWPAETIPGLPLDQSPFDLAELLRGEATTEQAPVWPSAPESYPAAVENLDAVLAGLGDVLPFSLDDAIAPGAGGGDGDVVDFSDINDAPFDPATLPGLTAAAPPVVELPETKEPGIELIADSVVEISPMWAEIEPAPRDAADAPDVDNLEAATETPNPSSRLGLAPGGVAWPAFVSHTSLLIDRGTDRGNLFARLRESKRAAAATGLTVVERSLSDLRPTFAGSDAAAAPALTQQHEGVVEQKRGHGNSMTEEERIDLMAMRIRLIEDDSSAGEVAQMLEGAIARGMHDALASRVLGEAYLKLGRTDQAANQFRTAMLARQRAR